jgi:acyl-CoA-binding protein
MAACDATDVFLKARAAAKATTAPISKDDAAQMYAHYQQATVGPCQGNRPSPSRVAERRKYDAWKALGNMDEAVAKAAYVAILDRVDPAWRLSQSGSVFHSALSDTAPARERLTARNAERITTKQGERQPDTPAEKLFSAAIAALRAIPALQQVMHDEDRLQLFALHKQAGGIWLKDTDRFQLYALHERALTKGALPQRLQLCQVEAHQKDGAWVALQKLSPEQAMAGYCKLVDRVVPNWRQSMPAFLAREQNVRRIDLPLQDDIGLKVTYHAQGLRVEHVESSGDVFLWNAAHPESRVQAGDWILAVNGQWVEPHESLSAYAVGGRLMLHVRKEATRIDQCRIVNCQTPPLEKPAAEPQQLLHSSRGWCCFISAQLQSYNKTTT